MDYAAIVLSLLGPIDMRELSSVQGAIDGFQRSGWTPQEAASHIKWSEHVSPEIDEDVAIRHMSAIALRVNTRIAAEKAAGTLPE